MRQSNRTRRGSAAGAATGPRCRSGTVVVHALLRAQEQVIGLGGDDLRPADPRLVLRMAQRRSVPVAGQIALKPVVTLKVFCVLRTIALRRPPFPRVRNWRCQNSISPVAWLLK